MLHIPITPLDPYLPSPAAESDLPDPGPGLPDPDRPEPDLPDPNLPGDPPDSPIMDPDVPMQDPVIDPPAEQPRMENAPEAPDAPIDPGAAEVPEIGENIRPAGTKDMDLPPEEWTPTDEENDESFPASDPPGNY